MSFVATTVAQEQPNGYPALISPLLTNDLVGQVADAPGSPVETYAGHLQPGVLPGIAALATGLGIVSDGRRSSAAGGPCVPGSAAAKELCSDWELKQQAAHHL